MARTKKEAALTPEECLQAALVPDWEWPYKLPENWCWTRMQEIAQWGSGGTPSRKVSEYYNGDIYWVKTGELNDDYIFETEEHITQEAISHSSAKIYPTDTVVIAMYGATIGKVGILGIPAATNQACACAIVKPSTDYKYLFYYAQSQKDDFIKKGKGGAQPNISQEIIKFHQFPLPPLAEQHRIVDRIERLFAKLDEAKEKAQAVVDSFETRKAAILHKAFTGELTAKWREEHGVRMESWEYIPFETIIEKMQNGLAKRKGISGTPYVVLRLANLTDCGFNTDDLREILLDEKEQANYELRPNDVIMIRVNGSKDNVGKQYLITNQHHWAFCDHIIRIRYSSSLLPQYMVYFSKSKNYRIYVKENIVSSAGQNTISRKGMANLHVPLPRMNEQSEIVRILDMAFAEEQQAKEAAEAVLDQIDLMKKSILARAFRGELGTNDPNEESAVELLKQAIKQENGNTAKKKVKTKRIVIPTEIKLLISNANEEAIIKLLLKDAPKPVSIQEIMSISKEKFELMDALQNLERKQIVLKCDFDKYSLMR